MKRLIGLLTLVCVAWAQTQIQDVIYTPFLGQLFEGTITITGPAMKTADGRTVARWTRHITISNGVLNIGLEPNDAATPPGTSYTVVYRTRAGLSWTEYWVVPTSAKPLRVSDVRIAQPPVPQMMIQPSQILDGGASDGEVLTWDASTRRWRPRYAPPGGPHEHSAADITSGTFADARIAESNVTQHQAALRLDASQIISGTLGLSRGGTGQTEWTAGRCVQVAADGSRLESADAPCGTDGGGGVGGSGTPGTLPIWTGNTTLGNSSVSESTDTVTVAKSLVVNGTIESQSAELGAAVLSSPSGGRATLQAPDTQDNFTITVPAANGTLVLEGHQHDASAIISGTFADARIAQSSVIQHQAALQLNASQIVSGVLPLNRGGTGNSTYTAGRCVRVSSDGSRLESTEAPCGTGNVAGSGTVGTLAIWVGSDVLGNSSVSEGVDTVTVAKRLAVDGVVTAQSTESGSARLVSASGGSVTLQTPNTSDNFTITVPAVNGTLELQGHQHDASAITSGTFADARISQSSVVQHQAALQLDASQIVSGVLPVARGGTGKGSYTPNRCIQSSADGQSLTEADGACSVEGHGHTLSGDVVGTTSATSVVRIQGRAVSSEAPSDGQALVWDGAGQQWRPATVGGGGGSGLTTFYNTFLAASCQSGAPILNMETTTSGSPTPACVQGTNTVYGAAQFEDTATKTAYVRMPLPPDWNGSLEVAVRWRTSVTSGSVVWQFQTACAAPGESGDPGWNAAQTLVDGAGASSGVLNDAGPLTLTTTGCSAGEELFLKIFRDPTHSSDNLGATAELLWTRLKLGRMP